MFGNIMKLIKKILHIEEKESNSKEAAKERLHLVLIQDRASVSADFLEVMKQEIIEVIKKYIEIDESAIDVRLTNNVNEDGRGSAPALYANFPITNVKTKIIDNNVSDNKKCNEEETKSEVDKEIIEENKKIENEVEAETETGFENETKNTASNVKQND